jgi:hypothetical protein
MPRDDFERLATVHRVVARARRLTSTSQFLAMLYGQLAEAASLREIDASQSARSPARPRASRQSSPTPLK